MYRMGLPGMIFLTASMTAIDRASVAGASMTMMWSRNSTTMLFAPPGTTQMPSEIFSGEIGSGAGFPLSDGRRHLNRRRGIGLDVGHHQIEQRIPADSLKDVRREFHAAEILVVLEDGLDHHVAQDRVADPCFNPLDEVLIVQHAFELGLVRRRHRDDRLLRAAHGFGGDGRIPGHRRLDEPVRRHPDLRQAAVDRRPLIPFGRGGHGSLIDEVPGVGPLKSQICRISAASGWMPPPSGGFWTCARLRSSRMAGVA